MAVDPEHWWTQLRPLVVGRRVIVKHDVVAGSLPAVLDLRRLGATEILVVAPNGTGSGPLPIADQAAWCTFAGDGDALDDGAHRDFVASIHANNAATRSPPPHIVERIERFDPDRSALVIGDFLNDAPHLCGRPFLAHRRPEWLALDDKTVVDELWDRCGIERAPSVIVDSTPGAVREAFSDVDLGDGVVVNADASDGWTGGGSGVRWARTIGDLDGVLDGWSGPGRHVRVMPFLEGIPCSVHGIVFDDAVVALRPVEMITLRQPSGAIFYAGCATFWDPPDADREEMRSLARRVGAHLRAEVDYRGAFTVDGVMTRDGFRPTELNPRNGAGTRFLRNSGVPLQLVLDALIAGVEADWRPHDLERLLLQCFDDQRGGGTWRPVPVTCAPVEDERVTIDGVEVTYSIGPSPVGSFFRATFDASTFPVGRPAGPLAAAVWAEWSVRHDLGLPPLAAAPDVRASP